MWDWLWGITEAVTTTPSSPPPVVETVQCQPGYTYSDWELTKAEKKFEGTWVVEYRHYKRIKTDDCTGETRTERKVEGPFQLWPAVPHGYTESVSRPTGGTDVSGTPLRSSSPVLVGDGVQVGPVNGQGDSRSGNRPAPTGAPLDLTGFVLLAGALAFAAVTRRFKPFFFTLNAQGEVLRPGPDSDGVLPSANPGLPTDSRVQEFDEYGYVLDGEGSSSDGQGFLGGTGVTPGSDDRGPDGGESHVGSGAENNPDARVHEFDIQGYVTNFDPADPTSTGEGSATGAETIGDGNAGGYGGTTPVLTLGDATRDPGLVEGDAVDPGDRRVVAAEPVLEIEGSRRTAGDSTEMSNNDKDGQSWAGTNPALMCTPVNVSPAEELAINLADRALSKMDRFLQLTTGAGVDEWANFGKLGWGKKLQLIGNGAATIATLGGTALARKALENPKVAKVAGAVGNFTLELLTGGNVEQWKNFGEQSFGQKVWMIGNTAVSVATIVVPILAVGRLAPVLKGAGGLAGRLVAGVAKSSFGQKVAAWGVRAAASPAGQAVGTGARWVFRKTGLEAAAKSTKTLGSFAKDVTREFGKRVSQSKAVQTLRGYGQEVARWFAEKGIRSATDYLKTDLRNPLIKRLVDWMVKPFGKAIAHRKVKGKASKTLGTKVANWFWETPVGQVIRKSKLTPWHLRDDALDAALEGAENLIENHLSKITKRMADGSIPKGSEHAKELRTLLERLRTPVRHGRERMGAHEFKETFEKGHRLINGWFGSGRSANEK